MMVTEADWIDRVQVRETERTISAQVSPSVQDATEVARLNRETIIYPSEST
jgi:hypothetical protein